jgi:murein DD-endopeptidase MepM/ murein hydrolase activator NlpD
LRRAIYNADVYVNMGRLTRLSTLTFAGLLVAAEVMAATTPSPWRARRRSEEGLRRGVHELKDLKRWPAEPASPADPPDPSRFRAALWTMCEGMATARVVGRLADEIREAAAEANVDPFLLGALVYRGSRCDPGLKTPFGVGLLQIQPSMYLGNVRGSRLVYQVREGEAWVEKTRPLPRAPLHPLLLKQSRHHLRVGAALLGMWQDQHPALDEAFPRSVPHRSAVAHLGWGDVVRGTAGEDRALVARRRLIEQYRGQRPSARMTPLGLAVVSPLGGTPRVAPSGPGEDREDGARAHRGLDIDATAGEPVGSLADGVVTFTGFDLPGRAPPQPVPVEELRRTRRPRLGPGGLFVCIRHTETIASCYMHLSSYCVHIHDRLKAGDRLGAVGRSGVKTSGSHLHLQIHVKGVPIDPAPILGPDLAIPPQDTVAHDVAVQAKKLRLKRERHARWRAHLAARKDAAAQPR